MEKLFEVVVRQVKTCEEASESSGPLSQRAAGIRPQPSSGTDGHQPKPSLPDLEDLEEGEMEKFFEIPETRETFGEFRLGADEKPEYVDRKEREMVEVGETWGMEDSLPFST